MHRYQSDQLQSTAQITALPPTNSRPPLLKPQRLKLKRPLDYSTSDGTASPPDIASIEQRRMCSEVTQATSLSSYEKQRSWKGRFGPATLLRKVKEARGRPWRMLWRVALPPASTTARQVPEDPRSKWKIGSPKEKHCIAQLFTCSFQALRRWQIQRRPCQPAQRAQSGLCPKRTLQMSAQCSKTRCGLLQSVFHSTISPSAPPLSTSSPEGQNSTSHTTFECPLKVPRHTPKRRHHSRRVRSALPVTRQNQSFDNEAQRIFPECPRNRCLCIIPRCSALVGLVVLGLVRFLRA